MLRILGATQPKKKKKKKREQGSLVGGNLEKKKTLGNQQSQSIKLEPQQKTNIQLSINYIISY